jgi:O-antigen/teichoic acid export membrane protein
MKVLPHSSQDGKHRWPALGSRLPVGRGLHTRQLPPGRTSVRLNRRSTQTQAHAVGFRPSGQGRVRKAGFTVLIGSGLGSAVSMFATPLITRIFEPAVYGEFALITGVMSVFVGVSTFRLEVQSLRAADDAEAAGLIRLGLIASGAWGAALTIATGLAVALWGVDAYWLSTGILVFLTSLQLLGSAVLTRAQRYGSLAAGNFVQGASFGVVQLLLGMISAGVGELIAGFGAARLCWLPALGTFRRKVPGIGALWRKNRRFSALAGTSAFINSLATSAPVLLVSFFYGDAAVGQLAIGIRLFVAPLSIIGQAAASANIGEVSRMLRDGDDNSVRLVRHGMRDLLAVGLIPSGLAGILGAWAVPLVLGREWRESGLLLAVLSAGALAQFVVAPFSQLLNLTGDNRPLLIWDTGRFGATVLSFCGARMAGMSLVWAVGFWSFALIVLHIVQARMIFRAIVRYRAH